MGLMTRWGRQLSEEPEEQALDEYPRPAMVRSGWKNLNGYWDYCFTKARSCPERFDGRIRVPFSPETELSGVQRQLQPGECLWYHRTVDCDADLSKERVLLHFGAVDQYCEIFLNGSLAGSHMGGYLPFDIDITSYLHEGKNDLLVMAEDETDASYHSRGKQKLKPGGMYYSAQSGIWQTVWMENVPAGYIHKLRIVPDLDRQEIRISAECSERMQVKAVVYEGDLAVGKAEFLSGSEGMCLAIPSPKLWSPKDPYLYRVVLCAGKDRVESYFAMRKCSVLPDKRGILRFYLNNRAYLFIGLLDQGYWPESLYTPPSDQAMVQDILMARQLGFNLLRKHAKVEPERWYYHCDRLGMLVWQDMVNGGSPYKDWFVTYLGTVLSWTPIRVSDRFRGLLSRKDVEGRDEYRRELADMTERLGNHPCIIAWVPFNEGWGQFDAEKITELLVHLDPGRLVDQASGWFDQGGGDVKSIHNYFRKLKVKPGKRAVALTEYGGYSWLVKGHSSKEKVYGYRCYESGEALTHGYAGLMRDQILPALKKGLSALVYTQLSDIEEEVNGLITYDREVMKMDADTVRQLNRQLWEEFKRVTGKEDA